MNIIGDKRVFAIQYEVIYPIDKWANVKCCVWVNNEFIGNYDDASPIYEMCKSLKTILLVDFKSDEPIEFINKTADEIYKIIFPYETLDDYMDLPKEVIDGLDKFDKYLHSFNEAFNCFIFRIFYLNGSYNFIYRMWNEELFPEYPTEVRLVTVPDEVFRNVAESFILEMQKIFNFSKL